MKGYIMHTPKFAKAIEETDGDLFEAYRLMADEGHISEVLKEIANDLDSGVLSKSESINLIKDVFRIKTEEGEK